MQENLTVASHLFPIHELKEVDGFQIPWIVNSYANDVEKSESQQCVFDFTHWGVIRIQGPDSLDYLNRMSTVNFKSFQVGETAPGAFLTGRAGTISLVTFLRKENEVWIVTSQAQVSKTLEHLEKFHFGENLTIENISAQTALFAVVNPSSELKSSEVTVWKDARIPQFFWVILPRENAMTWIQAQPISSFIGVKTYEYLRIRSGIPDIGKDIDESDIFLEGNYEEAVARNKGCYPGQEVVERIFTYGSVNKKLIPVRCTLSEKQNARTLPQVVHSSDKIVGSLTSLIDDPRRAQGGLGLAILQKDYWETSMELTTEFGDILEVCSPINDNEKMIERK